MDQIDENWGLWSMYHTYMEQYFALGKSDFQNSTSLKVVILF